MRSVNKSLSQKNSNITSSAQSSGFSVHFSHSCSGCGIDAKSIRREFSDQVWSALVDWNEIPKTAVDQPICNDCYFNLRDVLIDRADEIHQTSYSPNARSSDFSYAAARA
ncbi:MAG: hypothetical protein NT027_13920 [Proteobacteria bacterium]|nr:hypothetical protein [Pseudomonadota bacterium]